VKMLMVVTHLALGAACLTTAPTHAQTLMPCEVFMCMAGVSGVGATGGPACAPAIAFWHAPAPAGLAVWATYVFVPPASYAARQTYLKTGCPQSVVGTNAAVLAAIMATWGAVP
jgi:hypothetical protein